MPFQYNISNPDKIVFTRLKSGCIQVFIIFVGIIFALVGAGMLYFSKNPELPLSLMQYLFPAFGLLAIYLGINLPKIQGKSTPDEIIFDNINGRVEINQKNSEVQTAYIYYDEIEGFIIKTKSSSSSSGTSGTNHRTVTYHVYINKKDGGQWELLKRNTRKAAEDDISKLNSVINLSITPQRVPLVVNTSRKYQINKGNHRTELSWRNELGYGPIYVGAFVVVFLSIGYAVLNSGFSNLPIFAYLVAGFIFSGFIFVIGNVVFKMVKNSKTDYAVVISENTFSYLEKDRSRRITKEINIPLNEIHAISFSFDTEKQMRKLFVYTHEQFIQKREMKFEFSIEALKNYYNFHKELLSLEITALTAIEALHLELFLQQQMLELGNIEVT